MNGAVYFVTEMNQYERVKSSLDSHLNKLGTHYDIVLEHQKTMADAVYKTTIMQKKVVGILSQAWKTSDEKKETP